MIARPDRLLTRPFHISHMDPLSDVLHAVRLTGAYFYLVEAGAPWSITTCPARELTPRVLPDVEHLISFHVLLDGACWGGIDADSQVELEPGDVIMFPHGDSHVMSNTRGKRRKDCLESDTSRRHPNTVHLGPPDTRDTTLVCGFLGCDVRPFNPLLSTLPRCLHVPGAGHGWLSNFPRKAVDESRESRLGGNTMLTRMA